MSSNNSSEECLITAYHQKVGEMQALVENLQTKIESFGPKKAQPSNNPLEIHQQLQRALEYVDDPKLLTSLKKMKNTMK